VDTVTDTERMSCRRAGVDGVGAERAIHRAAARAGHHHAMMLAIATAARRQVRLALGT